MKVALAQMSPCLGDIRKNFDFHAELLEKAKKKGAELLVFPELSLTGYTLRDLVAEVAIRPVNDAYFKKFKALSRTLSFVLGFVEEKDKGLFYNSAAFFAGGRILHIHRKVFLPTYGMFEEGRFFAQGKNFITFPTPWAKVGLMICRDFLHSGAGYLLLAGGSEIIIVLSAAPGRGSSDKEQFATSRMWELMGEAVSRFSNAFVIYCNRAGFEDGKAFAGGSFIFNPLGRLIVKAPSLEEKLLFADLDLREIREASQAMPFKRDDRPEIILHALRRIIKSYED